jgi:uroporphyrinogen decarboxylase
MDPHIKQFEILKETETEVVVRTGFEAVIRKKFADPMPEFLHFETDTIEKAEAFEFDDPWDERRYFGAGDNQIAGVGDGFARNSPPWIDTVKSLYPNFPVYGSQCEANENMTRIVGPENLLLWVGLYPERFGRFVERTNEFALECLKAQIKAADGLIDGMVIWGDIAYKKDMFFSPDYWRDTTSPASRPWSMSVTPMACRSSITAVATSAVCSKTSSRSALTPITPWRPRPGWTWWICGANTATGSASAAT